jgi:hypothetical protein
VLDDAEERRHRKPSLHAQASSIAPPRPYNGKARLAAGFS